MKIINLIKTFWSIGIVVMTIIGTSHAFDIYINSKALKKLNQLEESQLSNDKFYNDGVEMGWKVGLMKASRIIADNGGDFTITFELSKDSTAYNYLLYKVKKP